jgi:serine/threonine-protein kinase
LAPIDPDRWRALAPLLDQALELDAAARATWLAALQARSPSLAADLLTLLSGEAEADRRGFLTTPPVPPVSLAGQQIGAWTLEHPLGSGGMGSVWLARRTDGRFEGHAAVKLMNLALVTDAGQERFRREGTVLARLTHPGIARLYDAGVAGSGQPYLVLEHIEGQRIDAFVVEHRLTPEQRIELVLQVLDAVAHAHAKLIVHRDIKPSNILVTAQGSVKLLDFGIAKLLEGEAPEERTATTQAGGALTPDYAAPEQVTGGEVTTATDVYACGVLLYLLLSGRHPTRAASPTAAEAVRTVLEVEPGRLQLGDLDTILAKALRKAPAERYQGAAAFGDDLRRYLRQEPVSARPDSLAYRVRKFVRRNRAGVFLAATVAAVLLGATLFSLRQMQNARRQRDVAIRASRRAFAMSELQGVLASDSRAPNGQALNSDQRIALAEQVLRRQFRNEPWLVAELMVDLAGRFKTTSDDAALLDMLDRARTVAREAGLPAQVALAGCTRSSVYWLEDRIDSARVELSDAKGALAQAGAAADNEIMAACLEAEGKLLQATGNGDSGVVLLRRAVELLGDSAGASGANMMGSLSEVLRLSGRTREAIPIQQRVMAGLEARGYGETEDYTVLVSVMERALSDLGEFAAIDSALRTLVAKREAAYGVGQVPTLIAFLYGQNKLRLGELDSADLWIGRALRDTTQDAAALANWLPPALTQLRLEQGRMEEAGAAAARLPGGLRGRRATAAMLRARLLWAQGRSAAASELLERELTALYRESPKTQTLFTLPLVTAGEWRLAAGDARGADSLARMARVAATLDSLSAFRSGLVGRSELLLAEALGSQQQAPAAREAAQRAQVALSRGYGPENPWTMRAQVLLDSLPR